MSPVVNATDLRALRQSLRKQRNTLSSKQRLEAAKRATHHLLRAPWLQRKAHVGVFLSSDGELPTEPLIAALHARGHHLYLPVLAQPFPHPMLFAPWAPEEPLKPNRYRILEPINRQYRHGCQLDVVITPLVAFDAQGHRLGMGGGYYDRTFACRKNGARKKSGTPLLIGWAYAFQQVDALPTQPWDVPLDGVVTENGVQRFTRKT